jgi:hypothetical protein
MSSTFVPVDSPNAVWSFDELKHETHGYTIAVDKVEFYNDETRIYLSVNNDGKATFYVDTDGSIIVQNKKQFNTEYIYDADYKEFITQGAKKYAYRDKKYGDIHITVSGVPKERC